MGIHRDLSGDLEDLDVWNLGIWNLDWGSGTLEMLGYSKKTSQNPRKLRKRRKPDPTIRAGCASFADIPDHVE